LIRSWTYAALDAALNQDDTPGDYEWERPVSAEELSLKVFPSVDKADRVLRQTLLPLLGVSEFSSKVVGSE
jgi:hypothetical protein